MTPSTPPRRLGTSSGPPASSILDPPNPPTPRVHKEPAGSRLQGLRSLPASLAPEKLPSKLKKDLKLKFMPDAHQAQTIYHVLQGYDSVYIAGTGYGKSLLFEGTAACIKKKECIIVISPLKALEGDQAAQAREKGLNGVVINEDTKDKKAAWKEVREGAKIIYLSPEMILSPGFISLWQDNSFRKRLRALFIDEAHCIALWGEEKFRPAYRMLSTLRAYTGQEIPYVACTATSNDDTFKCVWDSLGFGHRPFWGLDVGTDRPNLFYSIQALENTRNPVLDVLDILPQNLNAQTPAKDIPKTILYFNSERACRDAMFTLRRCLPEHLRACVQSFSSDISEEKKKGIWEELTAGTFRIACATDAAGMGCNVADIEYIVVFGAPESLATVIQRWGRAGRNRTLQGWCVLIVPQWAFRPTAMNRTIKRLRGQAQKESKADIERRANLDPHLEYFVNLAACSPDPCLHAYLRKVFSPATSLTTYTSLDPEAPPQFTGARSTTSHFELSWTKLDLQKLPPPSRCCIHCNKGLLKLTPASKKDPRLSTFASDFVFPLAEADSRPASPATSVASSSFSNNNSDRYIPLKDVKVPKDLKDLLKARLVDWRRRYWVQKGTSPFISEEVHFPDAQMDLLLENCASFLERVQITVKTVRSKAKLDLLLDDVVQEIAEIITTWRITAYPRATPKSQRRSEKRARVSQQSPTQPRQPPPPFGIHSRNQNIGVPDALEDDDDDLVLSQGTSILRSPSTHRPTTPTPVPLAQQSFMSAPSRQTDVLMASPTTSSIGQQSARGSQILHSRSQHYPSQTAQQSSTHLSYSSSQYTSRPMVSSRLAQQFPSRSPQHHGHRNTAGLATPPSQPAPHGLYSQQQQRPSYSQAPQHYSSTPHSFAFSPPSQRQTLSHPQAHMGQPPSIRASRTMFASPSVMRDPNSGRYYMRNDINGVLYDVTSNVVHQMQTAPTTNSISPGPHVSTYHTSPISQGYENGQTTPYHRQ